MVRNKKKGEINKKAKKPKVILYNKCQTLIVVFNLKKLKYLIFDEADRLLSMDFEK
jgi:superfamily II DNA/RNA helicase